MDIKQFLEHLGRHKEDRGFMADLRAGFSHATEHRAWPHLAPWCDLTRDRDRTILLTVAGGFATLGGTAADGGMGTVMRHVAIGDGRGAEGLKTFEARFRRFLACRTAEEVCERLPGVLRTAERRGIGVDLAQLHRDLCYWNKSVKVVWAAQFWGVPQEESSHPDPAGAAADRVAEGASGEAKP